MVTDFRLRGTDRRLIALLDQMNEDLAFYALNAGSARTAEERALFRGKQQALEVAACQLRLVLLDMAAVRV